MEFSKTKMLAPSFIEALNSLYNSEESWWRKIADDKDVFVLIRKNEMRVQANGGLLLHIRQDQQQKLICKTRGDFISLPSKEKPSVILEEDSTIDEDSNIPSVGRVKGLKGLATHYNAIKPRIRLFTRKEKKAVQYLANNIKNVVDIEVGYEGDMTEGALRTSVPRIDMAAITDKGTLVFFEVKLFENKEIHSNEIPQVVEQLKKYQQWMDNNGKDIIAGYQEQLNIYKRLKGNYFMDRRKNFDIIGLHPNPRLIITGFDKSQRDDRLSLFINGIDKGMDWAAGNKDLIATGDYRNLAKSNRLFLGLK